MQRSNPTGENPTDLPKRAVRALTEKMTVLPETGRVKGADDLYLVVSESGSEYIVDTREGRCDCPDAHYNLEADERCKHERRVRYATGETAIPMWADTDAIDSHLGLQTARSPVRAATDGGIVGEEGGESFESPEERRDDSRAVIEAERECPNGEKWCPGPGANSLPCFACFELPEER
jgi:predicted nucleic acid-binding Zn finger protein